MIVIKIIEYAALALFALIMVTQVIIPGAKNQPFFPIFKRRKLENALVDARGGTADAETRRQIVKEKEKAARISGRR